MEGKLPTEIKVSSNNLPFSLYKHQEEAFSCLDKLDKQESFSTLLVLPTGGGKTLTACLWLLRHAINKGKKVLWIAHRTSLLDQALDAFKKASVREILPNINGGYKVRVVSGDKEHHDYAGNIEKGDQLLIISKDSLNRNLSELDRWLEDDLYFVIDEAHHATARTYRKTIDYLKDRVKNLKVLGLTATPTRTADNEKGLLAKIFTDGIKQESHEVVKNDIGIAYKIDLNTLIAKGILAKPIQITKATHKDYGAQLGRDALKSINMDILPEDIEDDIANNTGRNRLIVETYKEKSDVFGKTIVFALNISHVVELNKVFNMYGIASDYVVSCIKDKKTGVNRRPEENQMAIEKYKKGEIQVLINVNILTEGVDFPDTQTVFLTRPTISTIFMTQMVGRALRGPKVKGGTKEAYIVSFFDNWDNKVAWVNPSSIFEYESDFDDKEPKQYLKKCVRYIPIEKIEQLVEMLQHNLNVDDMLCVPWVENIPFGIYLFTYDVSTKNDDCVDKSCQIIVYGNKEENYKAMMEGLPGLVEANLTSDSDTIDEDTLNQMVEQCAVRFFSGFELADYESDGIRDAILYYNQKGVVPNYYPFEDEEREKLDISKIAQEILDKDMRTSEEETYLEDIWQDTDMELLRLFFMDQRYFNRLVANEKDKIKHPEWYMPKEDNIVWRDKKPEEMSMKELKRYYPNLYMEYKKAVESKAEKSLEKRNTYRCPICGHYYERNYMQIDHIVPMNKKGKTVLQNLQLVCRNCNGEKSDK